MCANLGFIVHTLCHYCEMVATAAGTRSQSIWRRPERLQVEDEGEHLCTNKYIPLVSCVSNLFTSWHCLLSHGL